MHAFEQQTCWASGRALKGLMAVIWVSAAVGEMTIGM